MGAEAFFLSASVGERYCIHHSPQGHLRGTLLYLHPFGEEMNKSRRMAAEAARAFAAQGWAVLQIDLQGCGDSSGDFGDASWHGWVQDAQLGARWLHERYGRFDVIWALRMGALLAGAIAAENPPQKLLLWQPVLSGLQHLTQFLRLKAAAEMLDSNAARGGTKALRESLLRGETVEVAGYRLSPTLALPLEQMRLQIPAQLSGQIHWLEVSGDPAGGMNPASLQFIEGCKQNAIAIKAQVLQGEAFWQTTEISEVPALIAASVAALEQA